MALTGRTRSFSLFNFRHVGSAVTCRLSHNSFDCCADLRWRGVAGWQSGYAAACKAVDAGSIPTPASNSLRFWPERWAVGHPGN